MRNDDIATHPETPALRLVHRIHRMRMLGTALYALPVASVLLERSAPWWLWGALTVTVLLWPQFAWRLARRARDPIAAEHRNLIVDAAAGGVWIAASAVSLLPTAALLAVLAADRYAVGGWRLTSRAFLALAVTFALAWIGSGFAFAPATSTRTMLACLPLMLGYQVLLSMVGYRLNRTVARQNRELERTNRTDALSDLPNRRHFDACTADAFRLFQRSTRKATLLLIDIDHFKDINDRYGHGMGDIVLRGVADALRTAARESDMPARLGGDEFALLLAQTDFALATAIAERIRARISALCFEAEPGLTCTVSIGVSGLCTGHTTPDEWIRDADAALYRAKAAGRDRIEAA